MAEPTEPDRDDRPLVDAEVVDPGSQPHHEEDDSEPMVLEPARVMRIGSMIRQLLEEVRTAPLDERSRDRLRDIYDISVTELGSALGSDLRAELERLAPMFDEASTPSDAELRVAKAQLVGWLEGLFHGMQAALFAQQMTARQQLEHMRGQIGPGSGEARDRPGVYL